VLITIDALRADALGGPGRTPALERLAAQGARIDGACTSIPATGPAHASLLTGRYPWSHETLHSTVAIDPRLPTLAEALRGRGLATAGFVSARYLERFFGFHRGFDTYVFEPTETHYEGSEQKRLFWARGEAVVDAAMAWITENAKRPFFVWVHLFEPHAPHVSPPRFGPGPSAPVSLAGKRVPPSLRNEDELAREIRQYAGEVAYADAQVGRLLERLALLGLDGRSLVIVTSDHGESLGDHGSLQHEGSLFDEVVRVPLLVRAPGVPAGRRLAGPAQLEDVLPSVLGFVGVPADAPLDGLDLGPWLRGEVERSPRAAVLGRRRPFGSRPDLFFVRRSPLKWIGPLDGPGEVYDLTADPAEAKPRAGEGAPEELRRALEGEGGQPGAPEGAVAPGGAAGGPARPGEIPAAR
jgi:arylsulfatase A-like enzyme